MIFCDKERIIKKMFNSFNLVRFVYNTKKNDNISIYNLNTFFRKGNIIMKKWERAEIKLLNISETAEGGKNIQQVDHLWTDNATGDLYASYASGGNTTGDPIDVIKPGK